MEDRHLACLGARASSLRLEGYLPIGGVIVTNIFS